MPRRTTPKDDRKDGLTIDLRPSGRRLRVWDPILRHYKHSTHTTKAEAEAHGVKTYARFTLRQDSAERVTLDRAWDAYASEAYGITGPEADAIAKADGGVRQAAEALGSRLRANWRTVYAMGRVVELMRQAGAVDFKANSFRARVASMFNELDLDRTKAKDGRVAVSTKERMKGQVRALVNFAVRAGWLTTSPLTSLRVTGEGQQSDTTREVFTLSEVRALVAMHRVSDPVWVHAMLMIYAGMRDAEAKAVTWLDYEPERRLLWVRRGKGGKARTIPVQPELAEILADVSAAIGPSAPVAAIPSTPIARPTPGRNLDRYSNFTGMLAEAGVQRSRGIDQITGMERALCRHSCRHTFAAAMLAAGEDGDSLRIAMGHGEADLTSLYASQAATFRAEAEAEGWRRGRLRFMCPAGKAAVK